MCQVTDYSYCNCGAMTVYFEDGQSNSFKHHDKEEIFALPENFGFDMTYAEKLQDTYCCNHCVNHYGLDLCACGSGEKPDECEEGFNECGKPYEVVGSSVEFSPNF